MKTGYDQFFKKAKETSKAKTSSDVRKLQINKQNSKKKSPFPITQFFLFAMISFVGLFIFDHSDQIEQQLKKVQIGFTLAQAEEKSVDKSVSSTEHKKDLKDKKEATDSKSLAVEAKPDEADYLFKLSERNKKLDAREEELNKYAAEIAKQKDEIDAKLKKLEETRAKISTALEDKIKADDSKVDTLVQMYSNMKPLQAAKVFEALDEDLVIEILSRMKKKNAADILNLVKAEKAQVLAERYAGYRVPASK